MANTFSFSQLTGGDAPAPAPSAAPSSAPVEKKTFSLKDIQSEVPLTTTKAKATFSVKDLTAPKETPLSTSQTTPGIAIDDRSGVTVGQQGADLKQLGMDAVGGVTKVLEPLSIPQRYLARGVGKMVGMPDPGSSDVWGAIPAPNATFTDVSQFIGDKVRGTDQEYLAEKIKEYEKKFKGTRMEGREANAAAKDLAKSNGRWMLPGLVADWWVDPVRLGRVGTVTKATEAGLKEGKLISSAAEASSSRSAYEFSGKMKAIHGSPEELSIFKKPSEVDVSKRYDSGNAAFGPETYFAENGNWVGSDSPMVKGGRGIGYKNVYGAEVDFKKALVVTPENLGEVKKIIGDGRSWEISEKLKAKGYDGLIVRGMDDHVKKIESAYDAKNPWPSPEASQQEVIKFANKRAKDLEKQIGIKGFYDFQDQVVSFSPHTNAKIESQFQSGVKTADLDAYTKSNSRTDPGTVRGEKAIAQIRAPFTEFGGKGTLELRREHIEALPGGKALTKASDKTGNLVGRMTEAFNVMTGEHDVDRNVTLTMAEKRGNQADVINRWATRYNARNITDAENKVILTLAETTPNLKPNIPMAIKPLREAEVKALGVDEKILRSHVESKVLQAGVAPERAEAVVEQLMDIKRMNAEMTEINHARGKLNPEEDLSAKVMDSYLTHRADPRALKHLGKNDNTMRPVFQVEEDLAKEIERSKSAKGISKYDSTSHRREIREPLVDANKKLLATDPDIAKATEKAKLKSFFIDDPTVATMMRLIETKNAQTNQKLLNFLETKGVKLAPTTLKDGKSSRLFTAQDPKAQKYVDKLTYWFIPGSREVGNFQYYAEKYNQIFRKNVLLRPDYYLQNYYEGFVKNYIQGVHIADYADTLKVMNGHGVIHTPRGIMSGKQVKDLMIRYGMNGGDSTEEMRSVMLLAKRLGREEGKRFKAKDVMELLDWARDAGAKGEHYIRQALFINRLKQGYAIPEALMEVEKFHFNYSKTTKAMDKARLWMPFAQYPIKTALSAARMVGEKPQATNFFNQTLLRAVERSFNDPVDAAMLHELLPDHRKKQNSVFLGPMGQAHDLIGGNTWVYKYFMSQKQESQSGLPSAAVTVRLPFGIEALDQYFDPKMWTSQGPIANVLVQNLFGEDPFTKKKIEGLGEADIGKRLAFSTKQAIIAAIGMPNISRAIEQYIVDVTPDKFVTPTAYLMLNGSFGKFVSIENLDKAYSMKIAILGAQIKAHTKEFVSLMMREVQGRTMDVAVAGRGDWLERMIAYTNGRNSTEAYRDIFNKQYEAQQIVAAQDWLTKGQTGPKRLTDIEQVIADLKGLKETVKEANENYVEVKRETLRKIREEGASEEELIKEAETGESIDEQRAEPVSSEPSDPEDEEENDREPQSVKATRGPASAKSTQIEEALTGGESIPWEKLKQSDIDDDYLMYEKTNLTPDDKEILKSQLQDAEEDGGEMSKEDKDEMAREFLEEKRKAINNGKFKDWMEENRPYGNSTHIDKDYDQYALKQMESRRTDLKPEHFKGGKGDAPKSRIEVKATKNDKMPGGRTWSIKQLFDK